MSHAATLFTLHSSLFTLHSSLFTLHSLLFTLHRRDRLGERMYPTLVKFGSFEITTFGLMMFLAFVVAGWVLTRQFRRYGLTDDLASTLVMAAAIGGIVGAKIYYAILYHSWAELFSRAGLVWYGGLMGGAIACSLVIVRNKVDFLVAADAAAPSLAIGYAIGRIGCFLVGDDYGAPTNGWWG